MTLVLIVDSEETRRKLLSRVVELEGYSVFQATTMKEGLKVLKKESCQVVISDSKLPDGSGIAFTTQIKKEHPGTEFIVLTTSGMNHDGIEAVENGAFDYLIKGEHQEKIIPLLSKAAEKAHLQQQVLSLESKLSEKFGFNKIIGESKVVKQSIELARKVAATDTNVLLLGETGTGKEVFAQAIHYESPRKMKPFVALNCSAFPKDLLENELFGHAEGAYTGAIKAKKGYLAEAHNGTLFLDEIGEMNIELQAKLLRVIETGEFYCVGESKARHVDVRFIAATNKNLETETESGHFRSDLFYRLSVFSISLPTLRERKEDIPIFTDHFITQFALKTNKPVPGVNKEFLTALKNHPWKGNIRELKNVIERSVILADKELNASLLPADFCVDDVKNPYELAHVEKNHIKKVLVHVDGNKTKAAKLLGIGLTTLYQKIKDYNL